MPYSRDVDCEIWNCHKYPAPTTPKPKPSQNDDVLYGIIGLIVVGLILLCLITKVRIGCSRLFANYLRGSRRNGGAFIETGIEANENTELNVIRPNKYFTIAESSESSDSEDYSAPIIRRPAQTAVNNANETRF